MVAPSEKPADQQFFEAHAVMRPRPTAGIWLAHKPVGLTSFELVKQFQARLAAVPGRPLKVSHGGTLDPFADGLLPVLVGPATKLFEWLHDAPKVYRARIVWGTETDSGDGHGAVTATGSAASLTEERLERAMHNFIGWSDQVPPNTSNKRIDGERAYQKAHRGEVFTLAATKVYLHRATFVEHALPSHSVLEVTCRGGFYVRALIRDLGRALQVPAHLEALTRTGIGPWLSPAQGATVRLEPEDTLPWLPLRRLTDDEWGRARRGVAIARADARAPWRLPDGFPAARAQACGLHGQALVALFDLNDNDTLTLRTELHGLTPEVT